MASDDAYAAFLDKANKGYSSTSASSAPKTSASIKDHQANAPKVLIAATKDAFYTSESDEPFEAVALPLEGHRLPDEDTFLKTTGLPYGADTVTILDPIDWDTRGQYKALLEAVRDAGQGNDVRVYRVQKDATRVEYWLVTTHDQQLLGVKALAVES